MSDKVENIDTLFSMTLSILDFFIQIILTYLKSITKVLQFLFAILNMWQ